MSEPITLYNRDGETLTVYTRSQAAERLAGGEWYASQSDAEAGKVREEPTPATAAKLAALEGDAAAVTRQESATPAPQPEPQPEPEAAPAKSPAKGKTPS